MRLGYLPACVAILLTGCAAGSGDAAANGAAPIGYQYHDGNHIGGVSQTSPEAIYNAMHGTWLWPPMENDRPD